MNAAGHRGEQQQRPEGQPVAGDLGRADRLLGTPRQRQLVEHAVGAVGLDQPLDRQQRRGQRRDPQRRRRRSARAGARSGPTANGTSVATSRKKATGSQAAPPMRRGGRRAGSARRIMRPAPARATRPPSGPCDAASTAPPAPRWAAISASSRVDAIAIETVERLVEQPQRRAATPTTRASVARLAWPVESSRTGTSARRVEVEARPSPRRAAAVPRRPARGPAAARGRAPGLRRRAPHRPRSIRPAFGRSSPAARRIRLDLPLPLGPVTCSASPGAELEVELFEQQPSAADQRHVLEPQQRLHCTASSSACMSSSLRPK